MIAIVKLPRFYLLALIGAAMFLTSCATNPAAKVAESPKFQDESAADLVVHYSSDRTLYRLKPDAHEGAFYHIFNRQELCEQDAARAGKRDLAVVLIGYYPKPELEAQAKPWDLAPLKIIADEAGLATFDFKGEDTIYGGNYVICVPALAEELKQFVAKA